MQIFADAEIDATTLTLLSEDDLVELSLPDNELCRRLLDGIDQLRKVLA